MWIELLQNNLPILKLLESMYKTKIKQNPLNIFAGDERRLQAKSRLGQNKKSEVCKSFSRDTESF